MEEYKVKQIWPNHADHISCYNDKFLTKLFQDSPITIQPKYDGERMLIHFDNGEVYCTSRRFSKKTGRYMENQDKLPKLKPIAQLLKNKGWDYTVLDCECYSNDWSTVVGVLHSLPERAIELQKSCEVKFAVFDCIWYNGEYVGDVRYNERLTLAKTLIKRINQPWLHFVGSIDMLGEFHQNESETIRNEMYSKAMIEWYMNQAISLGFEGIVVKPLTHKYYDKAMCLKVKKFETLDVVVCGYQQGKGKYENTIGALEVGYYDEETDSIVKISKVNCGTDEDRDYWRDNWDTLKNSVIEVKCQEITDRSLRHPVYIRRREDKDYKMCTKCTIFKE